MCQQGCQHKHPYKASDRICECVCQKIPTSVVMVSYVTYSNLRLNVYGVKNV